MCYACFLYSQNSISRIQIAFKIFIRLNFYDISLSSIFVKKVKKYELECFLTKNLFKKYIFDTK